MRRNLLKEVTFEVAGIYKLPYLDKSFDIMHYYVLLVHLPDPIAAIKEMRRVCKTSGLVAAREPD